MADLSELLERLRAATGPDRVIDAGLCRLFDLPACHEPDCLPDVFLSIIERIERGEWDQDSEVPFYTGSIDAALALVERLLPGWIWDITSTGTAWVMDPNNNDCLYADGGRQAMTLANLRDPPSFTPPLAILEALLAALTAIQSIGDETDGR